ncbi:Ribonuclease H-like superfamily protein [Rhynchospora pubera]|uniref:Ribonuclease H-like superfamily protein n=1 Tax=Rhynchospora pubera TaxID=906938 RepID=A0AAV8FT55_9POAL|nr:Ribonuclease H-like superfamily protein [Rhynchospora pubera]
MQLLTRLFTPSQIQQIVTTDNRPDVLVEESDRLIWQQTKDGKYSVREGYKVLTREQNDLVDTQAIDWQLIWKQRKLTPKVKIFLWRLLHKGLPMAANLHRRINNFTPTCQRCNQENEYEMHCLFFCELSRQVWFAGAMGIRVHELPLDIVQTVTQILGQLDDDGVELFANTMWEIWKERNKVVIEHSIFRPQEVIQRVKVGVSTGLMLIQPQRSLIEETSMEKYEFQNEGWQVLVDASWDIGTKSGRAYVVFDKGKLHSVGLHSSNMFDPFQAETTALVEAMMYVYDELKLPRLITIQFFSDCYNLVLAVNQADITDVPSWRAVPMVNQLIRRMNEYGQGIRVQHAKREALHQAHALANVARRCSLNFEGPPQMRMKQLGGLTKEIEEKFFQRVQEAPP